MAAPPTDRPARPRWAVLLTTHNRRDKTLACLRTLAAQVDAGVDLEVVLVDAGSSDGTPDAVEQQWPDATVLRRGADLFWNAGMRVAMLEAAHRPVDAVVWLNDDTMLDTHAIRVLRETLEQVAVDRAAPIVTGATREPGGTAVTYGGVHRPDRWRPMKYERVGPSHEPVSVETMNGNIVVIPRAVLDAVGPLDPAFTHGMGDFDYGHRARAAGHEVWLAPGTIGTCEANPRREREEIGDSIRDAFSAKGLPPRQWATYVRRWGGPLWPVYWASPYLREVLRHTRRRLRG